MRVVNTEGWDYEQLAPYTRQITAYFKRLADKFPQDVTVQTLAMECISGARQLWLVLDDENQLAAVCMTQIRTVEATGVKIVTLTSHAGEEGLACVPEMCQTIEEWATEQGAHYTAAEGRPGWGRELQKHGYRPYATIWRKPIEARNE